MFMRLLCAAAIALLLGGCSGWASERQLIPVAERDVIDLSGTYNSGEDRMTFMPDEEAYVLVTDPAGKDPPFKLAFDLLREEVDNAKAERAFLIEMPWKNEDGKTAFFYEIAAIAGDADGAAVSFKRFKVGCSKTAEALAKRKEDDLCIFDDYTRLRSAALDALAWHDDARMTVETTEFQRESEPDKMAVEAF